MSEPAPGADPDTAAALVPEGWRGDEHVRAVAAAREAGLDPQQVELDLFVTGFKAGATLRDTADGAVVLRGRTALSARELERAVAPLLRFVGVPRDGAAVRVHDGQFELRVAARVAEASQPAMGDAKLALQLWLGFGLLGLAVFNLFPGLRFLAAMLWGVGLMLGGWQIRRGMATGRAYLAARLAMGLAMLAQEQKLVLPPAGASPGADRALPAAGGASAATPEPGADGSGDPV